VSDGQFLGFDALQEPWNIYKLSDDSVVKVKFVLQKIRIEKDGEGVRLTIASINVAIVEAPDRLRGPPGPSPTMEQIDRAIVEPEVGFDAVKESETIYSLSDGGLMKVKTRLMRVAKTSLFGPDGDPVYKIESTNEVAILQSPRSDKSYALSP
jgi:hypothetical protein